MAEASEKKSLLPSANTRWAGRADDCCKSRSMIEAAKQRILKKSNLQIS